jgi:hypothetical protein
VGQHRQEGILAPLGLRQLRRALPHPFFQFLLHPAPGLLVPLAIPGGSEVARDPGDEFLGVKRLEQVLVGPRFPPPQQRLAVCQGGQQDDGVAGDGRVAFDFPTPTDAVTPGHHHVGQDQVRRVVSDFRKGRFAVRNDVEFAVALQQSADVGGKLPVIFRDQHPGAAATRCCRGKCRVFGRHQVVPVRQAPPRLGRGRLGGGPLHKPGPGTRR